MCPVCKARFRGVSECGRCGADLTAVMTLVASAWRMRQAARLAIAAGDPARARTLASQAEQICHTQAGRRLQSLSAWLTLKGDQADGGITDCALPDVGAV